jgi:pimeloyl-ACP methyl ester carboxylesterase
MGPSDGATQVSGGRVVAWREAGHPAGRPLLWFHGGLSSSLEADVLHEAARRHGVRVLAPDRPGIGRSSLWDLPTVARWSEVAAACAADVGLDRVSVAGWSAGGPYALACAVAMADRIESVTLVAGMYPVTDPARRRELGLRTDRVLLPLAQRHRALARALLAPYRLLPGTTRWRLTRRSAGPAERAALTDDARAGVTAMLGHAVLHGVGGVVADYRRIGAAWGFALDDVGIPVTVVQGSADSMVPPAHAERLHGALRGSTLEVLPGAGHFLPLSHADELMARVGGGAAQA